MDGLYALLAQYGLAIAFGNVLLAKLGAPLPTLPVLLVTGAMATEGLLSAPMLLLVVTVAAMAADTAFRAVSSQPVRLTNAAAKAADAVLTSSTRTGATSRLTCGCRCNTTCSPVASTLSG